MAIEKSLVIIKHDGVSRGLIGNIIKRFERVGFKLLALELINATEDMGHRHYPNSVEWKEKVGKRTLDDYANRGIDPVEVLGTDDPVQIGEKVKQWNVDYLTAGPVLAMVWEGPNAVGVIRKLVGDTIPANALPGTIRGDFSWDSPELANEQNRPFYNIIHASGTPDEAIDEIALWFDKMEVFGYDVFSTDKMGLKNKM